MLNEIISSEESTTIQKRHKYIYLLMIQDFINDLNKKLIPTYILTFDQENAFDKVVRKYILTFLEKMKFPKTTYLFYKSFI